MLKFLHIENIAVIKNLDLSLEGGLNVFTGQTGAGKSMIIDSLSFLCGARGDRTMIRTGEQRAVVEGVFELEGTGLSALLEENGIAPEDELFVSRTMTADGKSTARINSRPVPAALLKDVAEYLISIHGQQDTQSLRSARRQLMLLDGRAGNDEQKKAYDSARAQYLAAVREYEEFEKVSGESAQLAEVLAFRERELAAAGVERGEEERLASERTVLANAEKVALLSGEAFEALSGSPSACELADKAAAALEKLSAVIPDCSSLSERLRSALCELEDVADSVRAYTDTEDPLGRLDDIEQRLSDIQGLKKKYRTDADGLCELLEQTRDRLKQIENTDALRERLESARSAAERSMLSAAEKLSQSRINAARLLEKQVVSALSELDMPKAVFTISINPCPPSESGADSVEFLVSANAGEEARPVGKIASGGELSRIMLALNSVFGSGGKTVIFDEIDAGISGSTSFRIGRMLKALSVSSGAQLLCVTHSAQLASHADSHYLIEKHTEEGRTSTAVRQLDEAGREEELARIIGGTEITDAVRAAARDLMLQGGSSAGSV